MILWFGANAIVLLGVTLAIILPALRNRRPLGQDDRAQQNIDIARRRVAELNLTAHQADEASEANPNAAQSRAETHAAAHAETAETRAEIEGALLDDLDGMQAAKHAHRADSNSDSDSAAPPLRQPPRIANAIVIAVLVPLLSFGLYFSLADPRAFVPAAHLTKPAPASRAHIALMQAVGRQLETLETRLPAEPGEAEDWAAAGTAYMRGGQFTAAEHAYQKLHAQVGDDAEVLVAWAHASVMAQYGAYSAAVAARLERALAMQPEHENALWSAAAGAALQGKYRQAIHYLQRLLPLLASQSVAHTYATQWLTALHARSETATPNLPVADDADE